MPKRRDFLKKTAMGVVALPFTLRCLQRGAAAGRKPNLFNCLSAIADGIGETKDLSNQQPDLAKELYGKLTAARQEKRTRS